VVCHAAGDDDRHTIKQCGRVEGQAAAEAYQRMSRQVKFAAYSGCYRCGVPQRICERWEADGRGRYRDSGQMCQFFGVMIGVVCGVQEGYPEIWERWCERMRLEGVEGGMEGYFGRRLVFEGVESSGLFWAFGWMVKQVECR
jgi:hypothetical protein